MLGSAEACEEGIRRPPVATRVLFHIGGVGATVYCLRRWWCDRWWYWYDFVGVPFPVRWFVRDRSGMCGCDMWSRRAWRERCDVCAFGLGCGMVVVRVSDVDGACGCTSPAALMGWFPQLVAIHLL
jgi:hypothetical protein